MGKRTWIQTGLCLVMLLAALLLGSAALAEGGGETAAPQFTVTDTEVARGEFFEIEVSPVEGVNYYRVYLQQGEDRVWSAIANGAGKLWLTTVNAEPGEYQLVGYCLADDGETELSQSQGMSVTVTENNALADGVSFDVKWRDNMPVGDYVYVSLYAPDAAYSAIVTDTNELPGWSTMRSILNTAENHTFSAYAVFPDGTVVTCPTYTVTPTSLGAVGAVELGELPGTVTAGEDVSGSYSVSLTDGAQARVFIEVTDDGGNTVYSVQDDESTGNFTIPAVQSDDESGETWNTFEPSRVYTVGVGLEPVGKGYEYAYEGAEVAILPETDPESPVLLWVAEEDTELTVPVHDELLVSVSAPGASAIRFFDGNDWKWKNPDNCRDWHQEGGEFDIRFDWSHHQSAVVYAQACYGDPGDENAEWINSNPVFVKMAADEQAPAPEFNAARAVVRGEMLTVELQDTNTAEWYWVDVNDLDGNNMFHMDGPDDCGVFSIPTVNLQPGQYTLYVGDAAPGYMDNNREWGFAVLEPEQGALDGIVWTFSCEDNTVETMEPFSFSVWSENATHIDATIRHTDGWEMPEFCDGDLLYCSNYSFPKMGTVTIDVTVQYADGHSETDSRTVDVTADGGSLMGMTLTAPEALRVGDTFDFSFTGVDNAQNYYIRIAPIGEEWNAIWEHDINQAGEFSLTTVSDNDDDPDLCLEPGRSYGLWVEATARGFDADTVQAIVFVYDGDALGDSVTLTVNGSDEGAQVMAQEDCAIVVGVEGATYVQWFDGRRWSDPMRLRAGSDSEYIDWASFWDGDFTLYARAWFGDEDWNVGEFRYSGGVPITVNFEGNGEVGDYDLTVPETVRRGDPLVIEITEADNAAEYHVRIEDVRTDDNNQPAEYFFYCPQAGHLSLPTGMLEVGGEYRVTVNARGQLGYRWNYKEETFTVEEGDDLPSVNITRSADPVGMNEEMLITAYAPGAERLRLYEDGEPAEWDSLNWDDEDAWFTWNGEYGYYDWRSDIAGEHTFAVSAWINGQWTDPGDCATTVTVQGGGQLDKPQGYLNASLLAEGEDLVISFSGVENAERYNINVRRNNMEGEDLVMSMGNLAPNKEYRLPASLFDTNCSYRVEFHADATGYRGSRYEKHFTVLPSHYNVGGATLTFDGRLDEQIDGIFVSNDYRVKVTADNRNATAFMVYDGRGNWDVRDNFPRGDENWKYRDYDGHCGFDEPGEYTLIARYTTDDIGEDMDGWEDRVSWTYTNAVTVNVGCYGTLPVPEIYMNDDLTRGDLLEVIVADTAIFDECGDVTVLAEIRNADGSDGRGWQEWNGERVYLPTAELDTDPDTGEGQYRVYVRVEKYGWISNERDYAFTVREPQDSNIHLNVSKDQVETGETVAVSVYAPGADRVKFFANTDQWDNRDGSSLGWTDSFNTEGTYELAAAAHYWDEVNGVDEWRWTQSPIYVTVSAGNDLTAELLNVEMPVEIDAGEPLYISWSEEANIDHYNIDVRRVRDDFRVWHAWGNGNGCEVPVTMPEEPENAEHWDDVYDVLEAGEIYKVNLSFLRRNYNELHMELQVRVKDGEDHDSSVTLTVNGQTEAVTVPANSDVEIAVSVPEGTQAVLAFDGWNWQWINPNEDGTFQWTWGWGDETRKLLYAKYTMDGFGPEDRPWEDPDRWERDFSWSGLSNAVAVTTTVSGQAAAPAVEMNGYVEVNTEVTFTVTNMDQLNGYNWTVCCLEDEWEWNREDWRGRGSQTFNTEGFWPGRTYMLKVSSYGGIGETGAETRVTFTVTANGGMTDPVADVPDSVTRGEWLNVTIANAQAFQNDQLRGLYLNAEVHYYNEDEGWDDWYGRYEWDGQGTIRVPTAALEAGRTYELHIRCGAAGLTQSEPTYAFTVTEPVNDNIQFSIDKTSVRTCEEFVLSAYAPGACEMRLLENYGERNGWGGDHFIDGFYLSEPGEYSYQVSAHYYEEDEEHNPIRDEWITTDPITVTVTADEVNEEDLNLVVAIPTAEGEGLSANWNGAMVAHYDIRVYRPDLNDEQGRNIWHSWGEDASSVTVPSTMPEYTDDQTERFWNTGDTLMRAGEVYEAQIEMDVYGCERFRFRRQFVIQDSESTVQDFALYVNGESGALTLPVNTNANVHVDAPEGATAVLAWGGYDWQWYGLDENGSADWEWAWGEKGGKTVFAQYTSDDIEDDRPWEHPETWNDYTWSSISNVVTVDVTRNGFAPAPDVTVQQDGLVNSEITFTVNNTEEFNGYNWTVRDPIDDWEWDWEDWHGRASHAINTNGFVPGRVYVLKVDNYGKPGYEGAGTEVYFSVRKTGDMPEVQASVSPTSVTRGEWLTVTIGNAQAFQNDQFQNLYLNAEAHYYSEDEGRDDWYGRYEWDGQGTIRVPTAALESGKGYKLHVRSGAAGLVESETVLNFTVTEPENGDIRLSVNKTEVRTFERFTISVYAPGAREVRILENYRDMDGNGEGDSYVGDHDRGDTGAHIFVASARYYDEGTDENWWVESDPVTVNVTADEIDLDELGITITVPEHSGDGLTVAWNDVNLAHYDIWVCRPDLNEDEGRNIWHTWGDQGNGVTVPGVMPEYTDENTERFWNTGYTLMEAGEIYEVQVRLDVYGCEGVEYFKQFVIPNSEGPSEGLTLRLNGVDDSITVPVNTDVQVTVNAPVGATAVLAWGGYDWQWHGLDENGSAEWGWAWGEKGEKTVYAQYTSDPIEDDKPWEDYTWSSISNVVTVNVTRSGFAPAPDVTVQQDGLVNSEITFTVHNTEEFNGFNWTVYDPRDDWEWDWCDWRGKAVQTVNTEGLEADHMYALRVRNYGVQGLESSETAVYFRLGSEGTIIAPEISLQDASVERGANLIVTVDNAEALKAYPGLRVHAAPYYEPDRWFGQWYEWDGVSEIRIPTADLEARKTYTLYVDDWATGWNGNGVQTTFTVNEPEGGIYLSLSAGIDGTTGNYTVETTERYAVSVYAPGAKAIALVRDGEVCEFEESDTLIRTDWWEGNAGAHSFMADVCYEDDTQNGDNWGNTSDIVTLVVTAPNGDISAPEVTLSSYNVLMEGESLGVQVSAVEGASHYSYWLDRRGDGDCYNEGFNGPYSTEIPGDVFWADRQYTLCLDVYGRGYNSWHGSYDFYVKPHTEGEEAVLTVNGGTDDLTVPVNENIDLRMAAPEGATAVAVLNNNDNWEMELGNVFERHDWSRGDECLIIYIGRYTFDEVDPDSNWWENDYNWVGYSNPVSVAYYANEHLPEPAVELLVDDLDSVVRGQTLAARITNLSEFEGYPGIMFDANIYLEEDDWWMGQWIPLETGDTIYLPTADLTPGRTYQLRLDANGTVGVQGNGTSVEFRVVEPENGEIQISVPESVLLAEQYQFSAYAPGADEIKVFLNGDEISDRDWQVWEGDRFVSNLWKEWAPGDYVFWIKARYVNENDEDEWVESGHKTMTVTQLGDMPELTMSVADRVNPNQDVTVDVGGEGLSEFDANLVLRVENITNRYEPVYEDSHPASEGGFTIPAGTLETGKIYRVVVSVFKLGYGYREAEATVTAFDEASVEQNFVLMVNDSTNDAELPVNGTFNLKITAPEGATAVRLYFTNGGWMNFAGRVIEQELEVFGSGDYGLYALYTTDPDLPGKWGDWNEIEWSQTTSNLVNISVTNDGQLPPPEFGINDTNTVVRGEDLVITLLNLDEYSEYEDVMFGAVVEIPDEDWTTGWYDWDGQNTIRIPTYGIPVGEGYKVKVAAYHVVGYTDSENETTLTVTEPEDLVFGLSRTTVQTLERFDLYAYCAGAVRIEVSQPGIWYFADTGDESCDNFDDRLDIDTAGTYTFTATFHMADGSVKTATADITVTVYMDEPLQVTIHAPAVMTPDGDKTITVDVPDADEWFVRVFPVGGEDDVYWADNETQCDLSEAELQIGTFYTIECASFAYGRNEGYATASFLYTNATEEMTLTLTSSELLTCEEAYAAVYAPGATSVEAAWGEGHHFTADGDQLSFTVNETHAGSYDLVATAHYADKGDETKTVPFVVTAPEGSLPLAIENAPSLLALGSDLNYHVNTYNAEYWWTRVTREDTGETVFEDDLINDVTVPAAQLPEGVYRITAASCGYGWDAADAETTFRVAAPGSVILEMEETEVLIGQEFTVSVAAIGAAKVEVYIEGSDEKQFEVNGQTGVGSIVLEEEGGYHIYGIAYYADETTKTGDAVTVTATSLGQLAAPAVTMPGAIYEGENLVVSFEAVEHAEEYWVRCGDRAVQTYAAMTMTVDTASLTPGVYEITVEACGEVGYTDNSTTRSFLVVSQSAGTMSLPAALKTIEEEAFAYIPAQKFTIPAGTTTIGARAFANCANLAFVEIPESVTSIADDAFENSPYVTFVCGQGSYAATYAASHGISVR